MRDILDTIRSKLIVGEPISGEEALALYRCTDLLEIGQLAQIATESGARNRCVVTHARRVRYSNVCRNQCRYCRVSRAPGEEGAFTRSPAEVVDEAGAAVEAGIRHLQLTGGANPQVDCDYYVEMISRIRQELPQVHIQGFAPAQLIAIAADSHRTPQDVLRHFKEAGLDSILEDGADIFDPRIRKLLCHAKATAGQWLEVMREAHELGLPGGASMLYGHYETPEQKVAHLSHLRDLQEDTRSFTFYAPRAYRANGLAQNGRRLNGSMLVGGTDDLREFAVGRIFLSDVPHIRCYANDLGMKTTQIALHFGVTSVAVVVRDGEPVRDDERAERGLPNATQLCELIERVGFDVQFESLS